MSLTFGTAAFFPGTKLLFFLCPEAFHLTIIHCTANLGRLDDINFPFEDHLLAQILATSF